MEKGHYLLMSAKELKRKTVFERVVRGEMTIADASRILELSYRQCLRVYARFKSTGDKGLVHKSRGQPSGRGKAADFKEKVIALYRERYCGLGPTLAAEKLCADGLAVDHETLRRWLLKEGLWARQRKRSGHRARRIRKEHFGELVQMDGSHHRWFGPEGEECCLMNLVDDATGATLSFMGQEENTDAAMRVLWLWVARYGVPRALYTDRASVYISGKEPSVEEQLRGEESLTQFGRACKKLDIKIIAAHSPQAKGRVERNHAVYQDRLVHELRLEGVNSIEGANALLQGGFYDTLNEKFARIPASNTDFHLAVQKGLDLRTVFCHEEQRTLAKDWTLHFHNRVLQVNADNRPLPRPKGKITIQTWLDGSLHLYHQQQQLTFRELPPQAPRQAAVQDKDPKAPERPKPKPNWKHPWRAPSIAAQSKKRKKAPQPRPK